MKTDKHMTNLQIAKVLRAVAAALGLSEEDNKFRVLAYERAADAIEHASSETKDLWDDGKLKELPGIGENLTAHLDELFRTGKVKHFETILKKFPEAMFELMEVPGIGPKNALKLSKALGITRAHGAIAKLEKAVKSGKIAPIAGFGGESQAKIGQGVKEYQGRSKRLLLPVATAIADAVIEWMQKIPQVKRIDTLGSLRRQASTVGDIDLTVATDKPELVIDHFVKYPKKTRIIEAGDHSASLILPNDYQVDLMVQPVAAYGALLQHFTGSKFHNIKLREYAIKKGYSLSEYGIKVKGKTIQFADEQSFYKFLDLDWIPPELREGENEIDLAKIGLLPQLVEQKDIKGDLQIHSDIDIEPSHDLGTSSLSELAEAAHQLGYEYIGVTEHNPSVSTHSKQQVIDLVKKKTDIVHKFNSSEKRVHIFNGLEIDIQPDGTRALPDEALELLDYACVSIHSSFRGSRTEMTKRVLAGLDHPKVKFWAHPTARLLQEREGIEVDWEQIFDFCTKHNKWLEIDGWPNRLDLPDTLAKAAVSAGVKLVVDTDSHAADQLEYMRFGISVARRGWATKADVVNTLSLDRIRSLIQ
ncbi:MAG: DNA polymerase/3'-5' exonuclease PolX [bacterium]|nr:DNA polymerase/3'-5' exonuclease PolX [bacterium]